MSRSVLVVGGRVWLQAACVPGRSQFSCLTARWASLQAGCWLWWRVLEAGFYGGIGIFLFLYCRYLSGHLVDWRGIRWVWLVARGGRVLVIVEIGFDAVPACGDWNSGFGIAEASRREVVGGAVLIVAVAIGGCRVAARVAGSGNSLLAFRV